MYFKINDVPHVKTQEGFKKLVPSLESFPIKRGNFQGKLVQILLSAWVEVPVEEVTACQKAWQKIQLAR